MGQEEVCFQMPHTINTEPTIHSTQLSTNWISCEVVWCTWSGAGLDCGPLFSTPADTQGHSDEQWGGRGGDSLYPATCQQVVNMLAQLWGGVVQVMFCPIGVKRSLPDFLLYSCNFCQLWLKKNIFSHIFLIFYVVAMGNSGRSKNKQQYFVEP